MACLIPITSYSGKVPMRARQFEKQLARLLLDQQPWSASEIDQRTRGLREAGLLPVGGRGLNAPDITSRHAALILISLAATNRAVQTADAARAYASMEPVNPDAPFAGQTMFADALGAILNDPYLELEVSTVVICRTWQEAIIKFRRGGREQSTVYRPPGTLEFDSYSVRVREDVTLGGGILQQLAIDLAGLNDVGGWLDMARRADREMDS